MIRRTHLLALGTVGLLSLVGCSAPTDQAANSPSSVVDATKDAATGAAGTAVDATKDAAAGAAGAAGTAVDATKDAAAGAAGAAGAAVDATKDAATSGIAAVTGGAGELMSVVTNTKAAVEAGDFATAQTEFAKFGDAWKTAGEGIKTASPDAYAAIEKGVADVTTALGDAQPDKTKVMDALTALTTSLGGVAKP